MSFLKNTFKYLNKDELIFDGLIIVSSVIIQKLMFNEIVKPRELSPVAFLMFSFFFIISISYIMGISFTRYNETYSYKKAKKNFPRYMAWLIFPGIFIIGFIPVIKVEFSDNIRNSFIMIIPALIIISAVAGNKIEKGYGGFKNTVEKIAIYFSAITLSVIETGIYISKSMSRHPEKDSWAIALALILIGYVPYRLVIAFSPPVNKRNMIIALISVIIAMVNLSFF